MPWPLRSVIHTIYTPDLAPEPRLHTINEELVVVWSETRFSMGYSIYDTASATWGASQFEDHDGDRDRALDKLQRDLN